MPVSFRIDQEKQLIVSTFAGRFTPETILEARKALGENPAFDPRFAHILDLSRVTEIEISKSAVEQLSRDRSIFERSSLQVIVAPERLKFEFAQLFKNRSAQERPALQVTRSLEAALAVVALHQASRAE